MLKRILMQSYYVHEYPTLKTLRLGLRSMLNSRRFHMMDLSLTESSDDLSEGGVDLIPLHQTCNKYRARIVLNIFTLNIFFHWV